MKPFVVSPGAADDLNEIWLYLAERASEEVAERMLRRFMRCFANLAEMPRMGRLRSDLTERGVFFFLVDPYFVLYHPERSPLEIYAVLHTARDLKVLLLERSEG